MIAPAAAPLRLGVVSFVNTAPFIEGLEKLADVVLEPTVPSRLADGLESGAWDVALCSSIDYQRSAAELVILPGGILGSDGATMTVRLFAQRPLAELRRVHCDVDSHTSVALLRILLHDRTGIDPECIPFDARAGRAALDGGEPEAMLLIGDKVVTAAPPAARYPHQLDLGEAWREWTGLPFVFALWLARADADPARIALASALLDRQRRRNARRLGRIVARRAVPIGWPADLARRYLAERIDFAETPAHRAGLEAFWEKARALGLTDRNRRYRTAAG